MYSHKSRVGLVFLAIAIAVGAFVHTLQHEKQRPVVYVAHQEVKPFLPSTDEDVQFEFYDLLNEPAAKLVAEHPPNMNLVKNNPLKYRLFISKYPRLKNADRVKNDLILLGYKPTMQVLKHGTNSEYAVIIEGMNDKAKATQMQAKLEKDGFLSRIEENKNA